MKIAIILISALAVASPALSQTGDRGQRAMAMADTNGDGAISLEEFQTLRLRQFEQGDANQDGCLSSGEVAAMQQGRQGRRAGAAATDPIRFDTTGDGLISREEFVAAGGPAFNRLDRNGDGRVNADDRSQ